MRASRAHLVAAGGYGAMAGWWVALAYMLSKFLGPFGWFPLGFMVGLVVMSLLGAFNQFEKAWEAKRAERQAQAL